MISHPPAPSTSERDAITSIHDAKRSICDVIRSIHDGKRSARDASAFTALTSTSARDASTFTALVSTSIRYANTLTALASTSARYANRSTADGDRSTAHTVGFTADDVGSTADGGGTIGRPARHTPPAVRLSADATAIHSDNDAFTAHAGALISHGEGFDLRAATFGSDANRECLLAQHGGS